MTLDLLREGSGWLWPYLVVILIGFLPTEIWRVLGVLAGRGLDEESELFQWVRVVATALVAAVVAKLILAPSGQLAAVPLAGRAGAICVGVAAMLMTRRSLVAGLVAGEATLIAAALFLRG
ncbi:MAG: AzlD domain-containing protein [Beijerinckiaceae bacterium]